MILGRVIARGGAAMLVALAILSAVGATYAVRAQSFIEGSEDVPLAPQLSAVADAGMVFDAPSGRIVEAFATGPTDRATVLAFYAETLPALGWVALGDDAFGREGEQLTIDFFGADGELSVRFTLAPE